MEYVPIEYELTEEERQIAAKEGYRRQKVNEENNAKGRMVVLKAVQML